MPGDNSETEPLDNGIRHTKFAPNQLVSHYRVIQRLGAGGMGVVYKAEDLQLRRPVALKFVSVMSPDFLTRLTSEARAAAALNHPNICTIYDIDQSHSMLAMEFVEGATIADMIKSGPLTLETALDIAIQVGMCLQVAHERGITHRDIKSSNLMVTAAGQVKVLDFGLALMEDETRITRTGELAGTPSYMSPEQATGAAVDGRTDIWSLGVVLYEMLTGRLPFGGKGIAVLGSIVRDKAEPVTKLKSELPAELDRILDRALAKTPSDRYQGLADLCSDLRTLAQRGTSSAPIEAVRRFPRRAFLWGTGAVTVGTGAFIWVANSRRLGPPQKPISLSLPIPEGAATADPGRLLGPPVIAPDGNAVVVSLKTRDGDSLFIRRLDANHLVKLDGTLGAKYPFWSPDSRHIAFFADDRLKRMPAAGGAAFVLCDAREPRGGAWGFRGMIVFGINFRGLFAVPESGGQPAEITRLDKTSGENSHRYPVFLPDGNRFLYFARTENLDNRGVYQGSLDQHQPKRRVGAADGQFVIAYDPNSRRHYLLTQQAGKIVAQGFDTDRGQISGIPHVLLDRGGQVSASDTGVLVIRPERQDRSRIVTYDRAGRELGVLGEPADYWQLALSPDNAHVAVVRHDYLSGQFAVWAGPVQGPLEPISAPERFQALSPVWSPDSRSIFYIASPEYNIYRRILEPRSDEKAVTEASIRYHPRSISRDGRYLLGEQYPTPGHANTAWLVIREAAWHSVRSEATFEAQPRISPDGRTFAFVSNLTGNSEVYVARFPDAAARRRVSTAGGLEPRWRGDGKELFYIGADGHLMAVKIATEGGEFHVSSHGPLFKTSLRRGSEGPLYDVTTDGTKFMLITGTEAGDSNNVDMIVNWPGLLT